MITRDARSVEREPLTFAMNNQFRANCPSAEELSEYFDGFSPRAEEIKAHLAECASCRKSIDAYATLDTLISEETKAPEALEQKIIAACLADGEQREADASIAGIIGEARARQSRAWSFMRYAALFIATAAIASLITLRITQNKPQLAVVSAPVAMSADAPDGNYGYSLAERLSEHRNSALNANNLEAVSVNGGNARNHKNTAERKLTILPDVVSHVWHSNDTAAAAKFLTHLKGVKFTELGEGDELGIRTFTCTASDTDLQALTNTLYKQPGWSLLSPALPQPNEDSKIFFRNRPVKYVVTLVSDER